MPEATVHLITGGARSGKSRYAERLALSLAGERATHLATLAPDDHEMRERVRRHRARRPSGWATIELTRDVTPTTIRAALTGGKTLIAVTNEVGSGIVPANRLGRLYRAALGLTNQRLAQHADTVTLLTAGLPLPLKGTPPQEPI